MFLYEIVANGRNGIDVDKFDYLARDTFNLGAITSIYVTVGWGIIGRLSCCHRPAQQLRLHAFDVIQSRYWWQHSLSQKGSLQRVRGTPLVTCARRWSRLRLNCPTNGTLYLLTEC